MKGNTNNKIIILSKGFVTTPLIAKKFEACRVYIKYTKYFEVFYYYNYFVKYTAIIPSSDPVGLPRDSTQRKEVE
jgi:hypothetical protein